MGGIDLWYWGCRCVFGEAMTHDDTVCLTLYRRVFPPSPDPATGRCQLDSDGDATEAST